MRIGVIGAGFTGLTAAYKLASVGHEVTIFERENQPGGLAIGFRDSRWSQDLEKHYHHWFESDNYVKSLAREIGHHVEFHRPKTSTWINNKITQLDSPLSLLNFSHLSLFDRARTAFGLALLKLNPIWYPLEFITSKSFIKLVMGENSWKLLWEPLFTGKFSQHSDSISAVWFWARIFKRSSKLGYPSGGFQSFANSIETAAIKHHAHFYYGVAVVEIINKSDNKVKVTLENKESYTFDKVINTLPTPLFIKMTKELPKSYIDQYANLLGIGAVNLILSLKKPFLIDNTYWLNINDRRIPFLAVVEHTNFISPKYYNNDHLLYIGNYLPSSHKYFNYTSLELISEFSPYLRQINPSFNSNWVKSAWLWKANYAQPIVTTHYSRFIPPLTTPLPNIYLANMQQVYPWDRGTNYAVELGMKVSKICVTD